MTIQTRTRPTGFAVLLAAAALAAPVGSQETETRPPCARLASADGARAPLDEAQRAAVVEALQDEYQGQALYARVLEELGEIRPFSNVVHAEGRHAGFLEEVLTGRGLLVPANAWAKADVPTYASRLEACEAAVEFEVRNVALYDRFLADETLPDDVRQAFDHNRMASLDHHKPAFERCASGGHGRGHGASASGRGPRGGRRAMGRQARGCGGCGGCGNCGGGACCGQGRCRRGGSATSSAPAESGS